MEDHGSSRTNHRAIVHATIANHYRGMGIQLLKANSQAQFGNTGPKLPPDRVSKEAQCRSSMDLAPVCRELRLDRVPSSCITIDKPAVSMPILIPFHIEDPRGSILYPHYFLRLDQYFDLLDTHHTYLSLHFAMSNNNAFPSSGFAKWRASVTRQVTSSPSVCRLLACHCFIC